MKRIKAFTLIEVMISIFIFTTAMLGYMAFHAHSMAVLFDNESAQFAHSLAFNLIDEINSMSFEAFGDMVGDPSAVPAKTAMVGTSSQSDVIMADPKLLGPTFKSSPFNILGEHEDPSSGTYLFYRVVRADSYANRTQTYTQQGTFLSTLYQVDVDVYWPKKGYPKAKCASLYSEEQCNHISIPLVRSNHK